MKSLIRHLNSQKLIKMDPLRMDINAWIPNPEGGEGEFDIPID